MMAAAMVEKLKCSHSTMCAASERTAMSMPSPWRASRPSSACSTTPRDSGPCDLPSKCSSASSTVSSGITSFRDSFIVSAATTPSYSAPGKHLVPVHNNRPVKSESHPSCDTGHMRRPAAAVHQPPTPPPPPPPPEEPPPPPPELDPGACDAEEIALDSEELSSEEKPATLAAFQADPEYQ